MSDAHNDPSFLLTTSPPGRSQGRLAVCVLVVLVGPLLITAPFARVPLTNTEVLLPAYAGAVFVIELITSALLLALFSIQRSRAVLAISIGYLFSGLMVVPWALTFPGVFTSLGLSSEEHTSDLQSLMRLSSAVFCL